MTLRNGTSVRLAATVSLGIGVVLLLAWLAAPGSAALTTRQASPSVTTLPPGAVAKRFSATGTQAQFLAALADPTIDVLELAPGTYHFARTVINIDRTDRPLIVRPAADARVIFAGDAAGGGQFYLGLGGVAAYLAFEFAGVTFDGYRLGDTGIVWLGNAHDITFNGPIVQNSTAIGTGPTNSWGLYLSIDAGVSPQNIVADDWTVRGTGRTMSALEVGHPPSVMAHIYARRWDVSGVAYSVYAYGTVTDLILDGWTIANSSVADRPYTVYFGSGVSGTYSNIHTTDASGIESTGAMTDGGGNSLAVASGHVPLRVLVLAAAGVVGVTLIGIVLARSRRAGQIST